MKAKWNDQWFHPWIWYFIFLHSLKLIDWLFSEIVWSHAYLSVCLYLSIKHLFIIYALIIYVCICYLLSIYNLSMYVSIYHLSIIYQSSVYLSVYYISLPLFSSLLFLSPFSLFRIKSMALEWHIIHSNSCCDNTKLKEFRKGTKVLFWVTVWGQSIPLGKTGHQEPETAGNIASVASK